MSKLVPEISLMAISSQEERMAFILDVFSEYALKEIICKNIEGDVDVGDMWKARIKVLIEAVAALYVYKRDECTIKSGRDSFLASLRLEGLIEASRDKSLPVKLVELCLAYLKTLPKYNVRTKKQAVTTLEHHGYLVSYASHALDNIEKKLQGRQAQSGYVSSVRKGDVLGEGPGFEVVVGHKMQNTIRYSERCTGVILMHDPRDGHFLLVERYSDVDGGYVLEFPKSLSTSMANKESAAAIALRDQTGLSLRSLEKIGEIKPDTHMIEGVCEVYYGTFDLEENFYANSKVIRAVKRINEDGLYQAAYDGMVLCGQTLAAISIWHAFESVRKKRVANSKRVRTPKVVDDPDGDDE
jgi:hypothetical protein